MSWPCTASRPSRRPCASSSIVSRGRISFPLRPANTSCLSIVEDGDDGFRASELSLLRVGDAAGDEQVGTPLRVKVAVPKWQRTHRLRIPELPEIVGVPRVCV